MRVLWCTIFEMLGEKELTPELKAAGLYLQKVHPMADRSYRVGPPGSDLKMQVITKGNLQKLKPAVEEKVPRTFFFKSLMSQ